jgi:4-hydroxy-2-oxoheptanedioate aldolase
MRPNTLKQKLLAGQATTCGWLSIPSIYSAELAGHAGFDTVLVDLQHGMIDFQMALNMLIAISTTSATPMVRSSTLNPAEIMHLLDAGAYGVICPMISTPDQAREFVRACRYAPTGERSYGPVRGFTYGGADYFDHANDTIMTWGMIETTEGLANLDAILATPGLDGVFIGPNDLSVVLTGRPAQDFSHPEVIAAIEHIRARAKAAGKFAGIYSANGDTGAKRIAQGFDMVTMGNDAAQLTAMMKQYVATAKSAKPSEASKTGY